MMLILKRLAVYLIEISCQALLLSLLLIFLSSSYATAYATDEWGFAKTLLFFFAATIIIFMAHSGYLLTTAILRLVCRSQSPSVYAASSVLLFTVHLQIFFFIAPGRNLSEKVTIQAVGACIVFFCTLAGGLLLNKWAKAQMRQMGTV